MHLVVETDAALALELPDPFSDAVTRALERPDLAADLAPDHGLPELEEANLPLDLLFEYPKRRQLHDKSHVKKRGLLVHLRSKHQPPTGAAARTAKRNSRDCRSIRRGIP